MLKQGNASIRNHGKVLPHKSHAQFIPRALFVPFPSITTQKAIFPYFHASLAPNLRFHNFHRLSFKIGSNTLNIILRHLHLLSRGQALLLIIIAQDSGDLDDAYAAEEEIYCCEQNVTRFNNQAPSCPNQTRACQSDVLGEG